MPEKNTPKIEWLEPKEAAGMFDSSVETVCRLAREGKMPARKLGGRWKIPADEFGAWLRGEWKPEERQTA